MGLMGGLTDDRVAALEARINQLEILLYGLPTAGALPSGSHDDLLRCDSGKTWEPIAVSAVDDYSFLYRDSSDSDGWDFSEPPSADDNKYYFPKFKDASDASKGWTWEEFTSFGGNVDDGNNNGDILYWDTDTWVPLTRPTVASILAYDSGDGVPKWLAMADYKYPTRDPDATTDVEVDYIRSHPVTP